MMNRNAMFDLTDKVALITDSTKGIGKAIAFAMADAGARVVISSRKAEACAEVAASIRESGAEAIDIPCNISHLDQLERLASTTLDHFGRIDSLVLNAAVNPHFGPMQTIDERAYDKIMDTNLKTNLWLCNLLLPTMAEGGGGSVIIISSIGGLKGHAKLGIYDLSKAADMQLARNLAVEWGPANIRANCIAPGIVKTDFASALYEDPATHDATIKAYPLGRLGEPDDIAGIAVCLAARAGQWITGQTIVADGGVTIPAGNYT
jgi:NAD(P)-dependent dehydrogenase (short-subunit alcohol dehydrogenase family)